MDQSRPQLPNNSQYKRNTQVDFIIVYHLLNNYLMTLLTNKNLTLQEKSIRLSEMGRNLGMNTMESLASTQFDKIHLNNSTDAGKYTEYVRFLGKDFWIYMFGQPVSKVQMNKSGTLYDIEDKYDEQKKSNTSIIKPGFQMTRRVKLVDKRQQEDFLSLWGYFVKGLVIGAMKALTIDCEVEVEFQQNDPSDLRFTLAIKEIQQQQQQMVQ